MLLLANLDDSNFDDDSQYEAQKSAQIGYSAQNKREKRGRKRSHAEKYKVRSDLDPDSDLSLDFEDFLLSMHRAKQKDSKKRKRTNARHKKNGSQGSKGSLSHIDSFKKKRNQKRVKDV